MIHLTRHDAVIEVRETREYCVTELERVSNHIGTKVEKIRSRLKTVRDRVGSNNDDAFGRAALLLSNTDAFAGPDTIKRSYELVRKHLQDPVKALHYCVLDPDFERWVGSFVSTVVSPRKSGALTNLTT
jgi:hypothetical protein